MRLHIYLTKNDFGAMSKNAKRKALRYGKLSETSEGKVKLAVRDYLD